MTQAASLRCADCRGTMAVTATESPWEFMAVCACGQQRLISWAHAHPPPMFQREQQQELF